MARSAIEAIDTVTAEIKQVVLDPGGSADTLHVRAAFQRDVWRTFLVDRVTREVSCNHRHWKLIGNH